MLYKIDYTTRNEKRSGTRLVKNASDQTEAVTRFMDWFFAAYPHDAVRLNRATCVELTGDLSSAHILQEDAI